VSGANQHHLPTGQCIKEGTKPSLHDGGLKAARGYPPYVSRNGEYSLSAVNQDSQNQQAHHVVGLAFDDRLQPSAEVGEIAMAAGVPSPHLEDRVELAVAEPGEGEGGTRGEHRADVVEGIPQPVAGILCKALRIVIHEPAIPLHHAHALRKGSDELLVLLIPFAYVTVLDVHAPGDASVQRMGPLGVSPRYVLGVHPGLHDCAAALLRDGELVAMVEQERLSRNRRALREPPSDAIGACLDQEGIELGAVVEIAIGWDVPAVLSAMGAGPFDEREFAKWLVGDRGTSGQSLPPLRYVEHHIAHAASGFYTSGFEEAAILVVDGRGETVATSVATGGPGGIEILRTWGTDLSLGHLYGSAASWAGLTKWDAGKLMGLASYGEACQPVPLAASASSGYTIANAPPADSPVSTHLDQLEERMHDSFRTHNYPFGRGSPADVMAYANFAASIQGALEDVLLQLGRLARSESGHRNLVLTGGVALNCTANGALIRSGMFNDVWIPPFPYDAGVSFGAALVADRAIRGTAPTPPRLPHAFWAPNTGGVDAGVSSELSDCEIDRLGEADLAETVARHIEDGKLVGWWQGRAEVGQRALGARSILCDPRERRSLVRANHVKGREGWRPLAPAVLADHAGALFDDPLPAAADFMLAAWPVREQAWLQVPAAVHVDGSARPQVVRPQQSRYHAVIQAFHERTGVPAVINTSFNLAGEPIVLSPFDAVDTFLRSDLDVLVLDDLIAVKAPGQEPRVSTRTRRPQPAEANPNWPPSWLRAAVEQRTS
jgi:carbamoyltransferase